MPLIKNFPKASWRLAKIAIGGVVLTGLAAGTIAYAQAKPLATVGKVELDKYLGVWYEVARKPIYFERKCAYNITATYTVNENGNIIVDNKCYDGDGNLVKKVNPDNSKTIYVLGIYEVDKTSGGAMPTPSCLPQIRR